MFSRPGLPNRADHHVDMFNSSSPDDVAALIIHEMTFVLLQTCPIRGRVRTRFRFISPVRGKTCLAQRLTFNFAGFR